MLNIDDLYKNNEKYEKFMDFFMVYMKENKVFMK